jgi:hypothetical protein
MTSLLALGSPLWFSRGSPRSGSLAMAALLALGSPLAERAPLSLSSPA